MKRGMIVILALLTMVCFSGYALAASLPRLEGKPEAFDPNHSKGYFIWQDEQGLHLRTTTPGTEHVFSGVLYTDGTFEDVWGKSLGADDEFHVNGERDKITFKFTSTGGADGIDLQVCEGSYVSFNLSMDGDDVDPASIFIGSEGWHPGSYKFTLRQEEERPERYVADDRTQVIIVGGFYWGWDGPYYHHWHHGHHW